MKFQKVMLISKNEISSWESCKHITNNLAQSYFEAFNMASLETLKVSENFTLFAATQCAQNIKENHFDLIVWLDHKPNAAIMLEALNIVFEGAAFESKPKFVVHLFGDFVLDCLKWESVESALKSYPVHFIAASERQKKLVDTFFSSSTSVCSVMPFPVNKDLFNVENMVDNREKYRQQFGASDDFVILYTGRISYQKNVDTIAKILKSLDGVIDRKIQVWVIGPWDDIFLPYAGIKGVPGSYYSQFMSSVGEVIDPRIKFVGQLNSEELLRTYHAADLFMSLSTYNDEDYGMSVAEALSTGLPCLLSDWGGFSTFPSYSSEVDLVRVELTNDGPKVIAEEARKKLMKILFTKENNFKKRSHDSLSALGHLSIESCSKKIHTLLDETSFDSFEKCTPVFYKMCALFRMNAQAPFKGKNAQLSDFYREVYKNYVS